MLSSSIAQKKSQLHKYLQLSQSLPSWKFANDFIQFVHLIEDTEAELELLENLMDKFKLMDVKTLRNVNIGSLIMKMLHFLRKDESAQKVKLCFF